MLFVGLDIGGTNLKAGIMDWDTGELVGSPKQEPLPKDPSSREPEAVADRLIALAQSLLDEQGIAWQDTLYVGVACPGQIDRETGVVVGASTFPSWSNVPLARLVQDRTGRPATVLNDASAAASAEFADRGSQETIAVLTLGTGIGLGVVCAGRVVNGARGLIEGGHMIVEPGPKGRPCACGQRGCLETYASASAVAVIASERLNGMLPVPAFSPSSSSSAAAAAGLSTAGESGGWGTPSRAAPGTPTPSTAGASPGVSTRRKSKSSSTTVMNRSDSAVSLRIMELERRVTLGGGEKEKAGSAPGSPSILKEETAAGIADSDVIGSGSGNGIFAGGRGELTAADVFSMAKQGDEVAIQVVEETCDYLGLACVNICRMLDPDAILLSGGLSKAEGLVEKVRESFSSRGWNVLPHECEISRCSTCVAAGVIGAAGAAACEYALAKRRQRRRSSEGGIGSSGVGAGSGSIDMEAVTGKRGARAGWGAFLVGVGVGAIVTGVAAMASSRGGGRVGSSRWYM